MAGLSFPSVAWFEAVRDVYNSDDAYRGAGGGFCNCTFGVKAGADVTIVTMEGEECVGAATSNDAGLEDVDFFLEMAPDEWRDMLADIAENGHATLDYTLNTLDLDREDGLATSKHGDQYREDLFFRYNQTLQFLFDASARIETAG